MEELIAPLAALCFSFILLAVGFFNGRRVERKHLREIEVRESNVRHVILTNTRHIPPALNVRRAELVMGEAVIASDHFKNFVAAIRSFFGGELRSLETLLVRARREATLRVVEEAAGRGAVAVYNLRLETTDIGANKGGKQAAMAEVVAYGTACYRD